MPPETPRHVGKTVTRGNRLVWAVPCQCTCQCTCLCWSRSGKNARRTRTRVGCGSDGASVGQRNSVETRRIRSHASTHSADVVRTCISSRVRVVAKACARIASNMSAHKWRTLQRRHVRAQRRRGRPASGGEGVVDEAARKCCQTRQNRVECLCPVGRSVI